MKKIMLALMAFGFATAALFFVSSIAWAIDENTNDTTKTDSTSIVNSDYRLQEEDILRLDVFGEPDLTNQQIQVTPDGKINVAFIGELQAAGLTQSELVKAIAKKLEDAGILINPRIQLSILSLHKPTVRILGQVQRPGEVEFKEGETLLDVLSKAGSFTDNAMLEKATLTHKGSDAPITVNLRKMLNEGDLSQNLEVKKSDTIYIPPEDYQNKIYVLGLVNRPGIYSLKEDTSVLSAISLAGGPQERGAMRSTVVVRGNPPQRVPCNIARLIDKGDFTQDVKLQAGDVAIVPETKKPDLNKISQFISTVLNLSYLRRVGLF